MLRKLKKITYFSIKLITVSNFKSFLYMQTNLFIISKTFYREGVSLWRIQGKRRCWTKCRASAASLSSSQASSSLPLLPFLFSHPYMNTRWRLLWPCRSQYRTICVKIIFYLVFYTYMSNNYRNLRHKNYSRLMFVILKKNLYLFR